MLLDFVENLDNTDWLEKTLLENKTKFTPKLVTVVNPGNPSGTYIPEPLLKVHFTTSTVVFSNVLCIWCNFLLLLCVAEDF